MVVEPEGGGPAHPAQDHNCTRCPSACVKPDSDEGRRIHQVRPGAMAVVVDPDGAVFSSMDLDPAAEIFYELLTPAMPEEKFATGAETAQGDTPMCPKCGKPATWVEAYKRWYCYTCQEYLDV